MQGSFIGFNTAGIKYEGRFMALMLKTKLQNEICHTYYFQVQMLADLLLVLQNRMVAVLQRLNNEGETYKTELTAFNERLISNTPMIDLSEIQQPNPEKRVMSITLKPGESWSTLILVLQNEQIVSLRIDDMQVEALLVGIQQTLKNCDDSDVTHYLSSTMDFLMLCAVDLTKAHGVDYQYYSPDEWKLNLFTHSLAILFCCDTDEGKKIISGALIKSSAPHPSEHENSVIMRMAERNPKLIEVHTQCQPSQIFSKYFPSEPGKMMTLEECMQYLKSFYSEINAQISA